MIYIILIQVTMMTSKVQDKQKKQLLHLFWNKHYFVKQ